jgi:hypothetical protein
VFGFNLIGPAGSNVVIQASTDLQTWIPLQTNLLGSAWGSISPIRSHPPTSIVSIGPKYRRKPRC